MWEILYSQVSDYLVFLCFISVKPNEDGETTEKKPISGKKTKELKILDGKVAQNLCEFNIIINVMDEEFLIVLFLSLPSEVL